MEPFERPPTRAEAVLGAVLSLVATIAFGAVAYFLLFGAKNPSPPAIAFFSAATLISTALLVRSLFTKRRALTSKESRIGALAMIAVGVLGTGGALLSVSSSGRAALLGPCIACLVYGITWLKSSKA